MSVGIIPFPCIYSLRCLYRISIIFSSIVSLCVKHTIIHCSHLTLPIPRFFHTHYLYIDSPKNIHDSYIQEFNLFCHSLTISQFLLPLLSSPSLIHWSHVRTYQSLSWLVNISKNSELQFTLRVRLIFCAFHLALQSIIQYSSLPKKFYCTQWIMKKVCIGASSRSVSRMASLEISYTIHFKIFTHKVFVCD